MTEVDGETETVASAEAERRRDARIRFRVTSTRRFILVATTLAGDAHGAFSIRIDYAPDVVEPTPVPILVGQTVTGRLDETSAVMENDGEASYDLYRFSGSNAQRVVVTLRSLEFDSSGRRRSCDGPVAELPSTQRSVIASMYATMAFTWASVSPSAAICFVGVDGARRDEMPWQEIEAGTLPMPAMAMVYNLRFASADFDPATTDAATGSRLHSLYIPGATTESTGVSSRPSDEPWLMLPGTPSAHVMITLPRKPQ